MYKTLLDCLHMQNLHFAFTSFQTGCVFILGAKKSKQSGQQKKPPQDKTNNGKLSEFQEMAYINEKDLVVYYICGRKHKNRFCNKIHLITDLSHTWYFAREINHGRL